jgi:hypothetical protein
MIVLFSRVMILDDLPANDLIREGLEDLSEGRRTIASLLVKIASPKLGRCGIVVPVSEEAALNADHELYELLGREHGREAHARYNALLRELVSFERSLEARHRRLNEVASTN